MPEVILPCPMCGREPKVNRGCGVVTCCEIAVDYVGAWNSLPRAPRWTHEPPKVEGWYWWRWAKFQEHMCLYVRDGLIVEYPHKQLRSVAEIGGQWSDGPIQAPAEPEES